MKNYILIICIFLSINSHSQEFMGIKVDGKKQEQDEIINAWKQLPINASKDDNIYTVDKLYAGIPSQRVEFFIKDFKKILENVRNKKLQ